MTSSRAADGNSASPALNKRQSDFSRQGERGPCNLPRWEIRGAEPFAARCPLYRTESDTVSTTPLQVRIHVETADPPAASTKTANRPELSADSVKVAAGGEPGPHSTAAHGHQVSRGDNWIDRGPAPGRQGRSRLQKLGARTGRRAAGRCAPREGERGSGGDRAHDRLEEVHEVVAD